MQGQNPQRRRAHEGLVVSIGLSLAFLVLSYGRIAGDAATPALGRGVMDVVLLAPVVGTKLGAELLQFVGALILIHALIGVLSWGLARMTLAAFPGVEASQRALSVLWLLSLILLVLAANAYWYRATSLGGPHAALVRTEILGLSLFALAGVGWLLTVAGIAVAAAVRHASGFSRLRVPAAVGVAALACGIALPTLAVFGGDDDTGSRFEQPHVIIVGIDSLRTDFVQPDGEAYVPSIDAFLDQAAVFPDTLTPLARTFPAWVSLISGKHPHTTGGFVNLLPRDRIETGVTLPQALAGQGYRTVYAIDEVRFSNLDVSFGFDEMYAPPMGATDFLLGFFADTPLANILVNTPVGKVLFPYSFANRAAAKTYDPDTFVDWVAESVEFEQPTLLAVHFTLMHWPYTWADAPRVPRRAERGSDNAGVTRARYEISARRADEQFQRLMTALENKGALDNAVVVVLSDHGESLGDHVDAVDDDSELGFPIKMRRLYGHGTNVFASHQYNVVLGLRSFGNELVPARPAADLAAAVSLEDVTPTLLDLLDIDTDEIFDGRSLVPLLEQADSGDERRIRFLETEFNPPGISVTAIPGMSSIIDAAQIYQIDPDTDRVMIREEFVAELMRKRQYAAELDGRILAAVPGDSAREQFLVYFDPEQAGYQWLDSVPTAADGEDVLDLWLALRDRFSAVARRAVMPRPLAEDAI